MPDPILSSIALGVVGSYLANRIEAPQRALGQILLERFRNGDTALPTNHDVEAACRVALRQSLDLMAQAMDVRVAQPKNLEQAIANRFDEQGHWKPLLEWWHTDEKTWFKEFLASIRSDDALGKFDLRPINRATTLNKAIRSLADCGLEQHIQAALLEWTNRCVQSGKRPEFFDEWVLDGWPVAEDSPAVRVTLYQAWCLFFQDQLKNDEKVFHILTSDWLATIDDRLAQLTIGRDDLTEFLGGQLGEHRQLLEGLLGELRNVRVSVELLVGDAAEKNKTLGNIEAGVDLLVEAHRAALPAGPMPPRIASSKLTHVADQLVGRVDEYAMLDAAWIERKVHVITIVAWGGVGKTSLVAKWAARLAGREYDGADYFDWSFYSQGTREQAGASSDSFIATALEFFGDHAMASSARSPWDKGARLAQLVAQRRTLLVLDGLEPLQYSPGPLGGQLKDPAVTALLKGLAAKNAGLCLVTSRERVTDLAAFRDSTAPEWELKRLALPAGVELLQSLGVLGATAEFERLVHDVKGHALTLNLLGNYLRDAHGGDIRKRDLVTFQEADDEVQGGHAFRVMDAYVKWLKTSHKNRPITAMLRLLGLFDRPADAGCVLALRKVPAIPGLTEPLVNLTDTQWNLTRSRLTESGLASVETDEQQNSNPKSIDCHPLVREYFARQLREGHPDAWRAAHGRLFEFLCGSVEYQPNTLEGLQPLYQAVTHGCQAGMQQATCEKVYRERIGRGSEFYSTHKLGAVGSELGAIACFFECPWNLVSPAIAEADHAWLLNQAAFTLHSVGCITEALNPMRAGMEMSVRQKNWELAAASAGNLSDLEMTMGLVAAAVWDAEQAVSYADASRDGFMRLFQRTTLAHTFHEVGRQSDALALFREAETLQAARQAAYPLLCSIQGFRYCELLLADAERNAWRSCPPDQREEFISACCEVELRTQNEQRMWRDLATNEPWLMDIALDHLILSRANLYRALLEGTPTSTLKIQLHEQINDAVDGLRKAGHQWMLPLGLLTRAWQRVVCDDLAGARTDLDEAWEIAERGPMPLFMADIHLYRARLFGARNGGKTVEYPWQSPQHDLAEARRLIEKHGYGRRLEELADAEDALLQRHTD